VGSGTYRGRLRLADGQDMMVLYPQDRQAFNVKFSMEERTGDIIVASELGELECTFFMSVTSLQCMSDALGPSSWY
jgi:hypothetical protein